MEVRRVGVVGAGTMGKGLAQMLSEHGLDVWLIDVTTRSLDKAKADLEAILDKEIEKWAITEAEKKLVLSRIHLSTDLSLLRETDLVIESINENMKSKKELFRRLDKICEKDTIIASNTSTLSLTEMAAETSRPGTIIGLHFLHPVAKIDLVEIVRGMKTTDDTFQVMKSFVEDSLGKIGIQVYETPGYVTTRLILILINEAMHSLMEGVASAGDIDTAMRLGFDFHYGPLEMADRMGLDSILDQMERLFKEYGDLKFRPTALLRKMVRAGHLGTKTGEGFFHYDRDGDRVMEPVEAVVVR
jgi:3-hydroxybutyryl-CoA dehydrogenase